MTKPNSIYVIGEIGQNHNGSVDIAKLIIDAAARPIREELFKHEYRPMDAVKLTKRDLAKARFDTLLAQLKLKAAAGTLGETDLQQINPLFEAP